MTSGRIEKISNHNYSLTHLSSCMQNETTPHDLLQKGAFVTKALRARDVSLFKFEGQKRETVSLKLWFNLL